MSYPVKGPHFTCDGQSQTCSTGDANYYVVCSRISHKSETDSAVRANFQAIEAAISLVGPIRNKSHMDSDSSFFLRCNTATTCSSKTLQRLALGPTMSYTKPQHITSRSTISKWSKVWESRQVSGEANQSWR